MSLRAQRSNLGVFHRHESEKVDCFTAFAMAKMFAKRFIFLFLIALNPAWGAEFRSVAINGAILYDAPSFKATRMYLLSKSYPVEVVSRSGEWVKIRDANGDMSWIVSSNLSDKRTLMVFANTIEVRESPSDTAAIVFRAEKNVLLDLVEPPTSTWIKVKHRDGQTGYARLNQLWGL